MTHPWCSDVSRDEAIRAAEDAVERPALPDWRELPERVAALEREVAALKLAAKLAPAPNVGEGSNQPRGWLTAEERNLIAGITDDDGYTQWGQNIAKSLLARNAPTFGAGASFAAASNSTTRARAASRSCTASIAVNNCCRVSSRSRAIRRISTSASPGGTTRTDSRSPCTTSRRRCHHTKFFAAAG